MMLSFRNNPPVSINNSKVVKIADYDLQEALNVETNTKTPIDLPKSNVLQFFTADGSKISVRPSGTEPKIKFYASCKAKQGMSIEKSKKEVSSKLQKIEEDVDEFLK